MSRYPSALHQFNAIKTSQAVDGRAVVDGYVTSAEDAVVSAKVSNVASDATPRCRPAEAKLGILLIDHGSKRKAGNEHLHSVAASYQSTIDELITKTAAEQRQKAALETRS